MSLKVASWRAPGSILEGSGLDFGGFWDVQVAPGWPQGFQIPRKIVSNTGVCHGEEDRKAFDIFV